MSDLWQDIRFGLRIFAHRPVLTATAVVSLAFGIGANTAIFSLLDGVVLRPLEIVEPERLVGLQTLRGNGRINYNFSYPDFLDLRRSAAFDGLVGHSPSSLAVTLGDGENESVERLNGEWVSDDFFQVLGLVPPLGRAFLPGEDEPVVILSHAFWRQRFAADPDVIGRTLRVENESLTIVGVAPPGFASLTGESTPRFFIPIAQLPRLTAYGEDLIHRRASWLVLAGRLGDGTSVEQARQEVESLLRAVRPASETDDEITPALVPAGHGYPRSQLGEYQVYVKVLMAAVAMVLAIAVANVAGLFLVLGTARRREIALRRSLGSTRERLLRQLLTESFVLTGAAGVLSLGVGHLTLRGLEFFRPLSYDGEPLHYEIGLNPSALAFAFALTTLTGLAVALVPALKSARTDLVTALTGAAENGYHRFNGQRLMVAFQAALAMVLLVGAGLFLDTVKNLREVDLGLTSEGILMASIDLDPGDRDKAALLAVHERVRQSVAALPGVESASLTISRPVSPAGMNRSYEISGYEPPNGEDPGVNTNFIGPDYLETFGLRLVAGRTLTSGDTASGGVLVNETFVRLYWPDVEPPVGRLLGRTLNGGEYQVVGVVSDSKYRQLRESPRAMVYHPHERLRDFYLTSWVTLLLRTQGDPASFVPAVRETVREIEARAPLFNVTTLERSLELAMVRERQASYLLTVLAALALALTAVGIFGLLSFWVEARRREIGVRVAVGARALEVVGLILRQGLSLGLLGLVAGSAVAYGLARLVSAELYGVTAGDPATFVAAATALLVLVSAAAYVPARRASRVEPTAALRVD